MGLFGLGSFGEGLVKGLAESATASLQDEMERIEDSIKTASDIRLKRIVQEQDKLRGEAEKVVKALRKAKAQLGGVDSKEASIRAASLLKQQGDLDAFNALIDQMSERTDLDYNQYFGDVSKMSPTASDLDIAYSFVNKTSIPFPESTKTAADAIQPKGLLKYLGPDIDAELLVQERTKEQMRLMDLGIRDIKDVTIPSVEFKKEAFKLDGMTAEEEFTYITDKLAKGKLEDKRRTFYSERASSLAANLGIDKQMEIATNEYNTATDAGAKAAAEQKLMVLGGKLRELNAIKTGSSIEVLKLRKEQELEKGNYDAAAKISEQLVDAGAMSLESLTSELSIRAARGDEKAREKLVNLGTFNAQLKQSIGDATQRVTIEGMDAVDKRARNMAVRALANDANLLSKGISFEVSKTTGELVVDEMSLSKADAKEAYNKAFNAALNNAYENFAKQKDLKKDVNFIAAYTAHKSGISVVDEAVEAEDKTKVNTAVITNLQQLPDDFNAGKTYYENALVAAENAGRRLSTDRLIEVAKQAGKSEAFISGIKNVTAEGIPAKPSMKQNIAQERTQIQQKSISEYPEGSIEQRIAYQINAGRNRNEIISSLSNDNTIKNQLGGVVEISKIVDGVLRDIESDIPTKQKKREEAAKEIQRKLGLMSKGSQQ